MKLGEVLELLDGSARTANFDAEYEVYAAFGADLMSDVLAFTRECGLLLTGLATNHVVRTAEVAGIPAIILVRGKEPSQDLIALAVEKGIQLGATPLTLFESCGRLYCAGLESCDVRGDDRSRTDSRLQAFRERLSLR